MPLGVVRRHFDVDEPDGTVAVIDVGELTVKLALT